MASIKLILIIQALSLNIVFCGLFGFGGVTDNEFVKQH